MLLDAPLLFQPQPELYRLRASGADAAAVLHNVTTQAVRGMRPGQGLPAAVVDHKGRMLDRLYVYAFEAHFLLVGGPGSAAETIAWCDKYVISEDARFADASAQTALVYVAGPELPERLSALPAEPWGHAEGALGAVPCHVLRAEDAPNGPGAWLLVEKAREEELKDALAYYGGTCLGPGGFEALRAATGWPWRGAEITPERNPWELRLDQAVSLTKGCYLGQEIVMRLHSYDKVSRYLVGLDLPPEAPVPPPGTGVIRLEDAMPTGEITTAAPGRALAIVRTRDAAPGTRLSVEGRPATVSDRPFWAGKTRPLQGG